MKEDLAKIPAKPGVYLFKDRRGAILYVGKAKVLKNRVRSYFRKSSGLDDRKAAMMKSVEDFEFTVTGNELEALILEASLIKQHKPRYNVLLRDDKSYPYLKLTVNEQWPRLEVVRRIQKDRARYFGPYVPAGAMWNLLAFIRNHYRIPDCRHSLDKRMRPCIQYQIKKCIGPCTGEVDRKEYLQMIREIVLLLEGKNRALIAELEKKMARLSDEMRYEEAAVIRDRIRALRAVSESQNMVSPGLGDADVIGFFRQEGTAVFKLLFIRNGAVTGTRDFTLRHTDGESDAYLIQSFIEQFYAGEIFPAPAIYCTAVPGGAQVLSDWLGAKRGSKVRIIRPLRGIRKRLVRMAEENAEEVLKAGSEEAAPGVSEGIAAMLGMGKAPRTIGAFDISNIAGKSAVGSFVCWEDGAFNKSRYRHIRMDVTKGPDDYAMMKEVIRKTVESARKRVPAAGQGSGEACLPLPDLVIIDGGREHLTAAREAFRNLGLSEVQAAGLAKNPDRIFLEGQEQPIPLDDNRPPSLLLRRVRDEAHRFAVSYHRTLRTKKAFDSALDSIYGLGRKRRFALLERFGSIEAIKRASVDELSALKGFHRKLAQDILAALNAEKSGTEKTV